MCAICGIGIMQDSVKKDATRIAEFFTRLLLACQEGGRQATGVSFMRERRVDILRRGLAADDFVLTDEYKNLLDECVSFLPQNEIKSILGHCRFPTKGTPLNNKNNHPILASKIVGVHNGCISNDDALFDRYKMPRRGEVDTEAIFALISHYAALPGWSVEDAIDKACGELEGSYACALQHVDKPYNLFLFRANTNTVVRYFTEQKVIAFATSYRYLDDALRDVDLGHYVVIDYDQNSGLNFNLLNGSVSKFRLRKTVFTPWTNMRKTVAGFTTW